MIRVLIADDHAIVRRGIKQLLLERYPTAIIEEADDAENLVKKVIDITEPCGIAIDNLQNRN